MLVLSFNYPILLWGMNTIGFMLDSSFSKETYAAINGYD